MTIRPLSRVLPASQNTPAAPPDGAQSAGHGWDSTCWRRASTWSRTSRRARGESARAGSRPTAAETAGREIRDRAAGITVQVLEVSGERELDRQSGVQDRAFPASTHPVEGIECSLEAMNQLWSADPNLPAHRTYTCLGVDDYGSSIMDALVPTAVETLVRETGHPVMGRPAQAPGGVGGTHGGDTTRHPECDSGQLDLLGSGGYPYTDLTGSGRGGALQ